MFYVYKITAGGNRFLLSNAPAIALQIIFLLSYIPEPVISILQGIL
jgi:hypothetical protein